MEFITWPGCGAQTKRGLGLDNISILSFIVIIKCHNNRYRIDFSVS